MAVFTRRSILLASTVQLFLVLPVFGASVRSAPKQPVVLKDKNVSVVLDREDGLPYQYRPVSGDSIWGEDEGKVITAIVCRLKPRGYSTVEVKPVSLNLSEDGADFLFEASDQGARAASFHLKYNLKGTAVAITLEQVTEQTGFELIEVSLPNLATVREEDGSRWMAHARNGGALIDLKHAISKHLPDDPFFGRISTILPVAMLGSEKTVCVLEVTAYSDGAETEITGEPGYRHARIGTVQTYRVHGGRSYDMNTEGPPVRGNGNTPNLPVGQTPRCQLDFVGDIDGDGAVNWLDGARVLRARMPAIPTHYFDDKFLYLVGGKYKPEKLPRTTFRQSETLVHDIAMLTDYAPQVAFVGGWVYDGQDTGFPCEDKVNESMGGYEALKHLLAEGPKYNANVTLNVNYDDAYKSCPQWSPDIIAKRPDGELWESRAWAGEMSYITGLAKYMQGPGPKRVEQTVKRYGIHDAILVDALSFFAIRNDWDPQHPASGYKNFVEGRERVISEFLKYGVHLVSERLRYPFVGTLAASADALSTRTDPFGGEPIPLAPMVYWKSAIWGGESGERLQIRSNLFWHARPIQWYTDKTNREDITDFFYLSIVPWMKVHQKNIENFRRLGYRSEIGLGQGSSITIDWAAENYSVVLDGARVAAGDATFCPLDNDRVAFYARAARELSAPLPQGWGAGTITARALYSDHREEVPVQVKKGQMLISASPHRPVIIYKNAARAQRALHG